MSVPVVTTFCFCVSLVTGSLIIGYFYTVTAILEMVLHAVLLTLRPIGPWEEAKRSDMIKQIYSVCSVLVSSIQIMVGVLLIVGTTKRKAALMLPWTITVGISAAMYFVLFVIGVSLLVQDIVIGDELTMIVFHFARTCISVYSVMVVHSLHKQIMQEKLVRAYAYRMIAHNSRRPTNDAGANMENGSEIEFRVKDNI